jgi:DNA-binding transcriptional ArsR family regulator
MKTMSTPMEPIPDQNVNVEEEIFKSLSHDIRRNIIKLLGEHKEMTFTDLKNDLGTVESSSLSYHLKSMKPLILQKENLYKLSEIGFAALTLMDRIDESKRFKAAKNKFRWANIITIICWVISAIIIPVIISPYLEASITLTVTIIFEVCMQINFVLIFTLWGSSWKR